jgi:hypothetical protein
VDLHIFDAARDARYRAAGARLAHSTHFASGSLAAKSGVIRFEIRHGGPLRVPGVDETRHFAGL